MYPRRNSPNSARCYKARRGQARQLRVKMTFTSRNTSGDTQWLRTQIYADKSSSCPACAHEEGVFLRYVTRWVGEILAEAAL